MPTLGKLKDDWGIEPTQTTLSVNEIDIINYLKELLRPERNNYVDYKLILIKICPSYTNSFEENALPSLKKTLWVSQSTRTSQVNMTAFGCSNILKQAHSILLGHTMNICHTFTPHKHGKVQPVGSRKHIYTLRTASIGLT